jgi:phosphatidylglycerophosphate synthase
MGTVTTTTGAVSARQGGSSRRATERGHVRENRGWLATAETRALVWLAHRVPPAVNSDHLSALGFAGMVLTAVAFALGAVRPAWLPIAVVGLAINWLGDSLDGTLARVRKAQRPNYGYYLDHVLDIAGMALLTGALGAGGLMSPVIAVALLAAYVAVMAETFLATYSLGVFRMAFLRFGPTELRVVLSVGALAAMRSASVTVAGHGPWLLFDVGGLVAATGLALALVVSALRNTSTLYRADPLPKSRGLSAP